MPLFFYKIFHNCFLESDNRNRATYLSSEGSSRLYCNSTEKIVLQYHLSANENWSFFVKLNHKSDMIVSTLTSLNGKLGIGYFEYESRKLRKKVVKCDQVQSVEKTERLQRSAVTFPQWFFSGFSIFLNYLPSS